MELKTKTVLFTLLAWCLASIPTIMVAVDTKLMELQEKLAVCDKRKEIFLQERDYFNCLSRIDLLQNRLHKLEQEAAVTPLKKRLELVLSQKPNILHPQAKNDLQVIDERMVKFKKEHHQQISSIEREIAKLAQKMLQHLSPQEKQALRKLLKEKETLKSDIGQLDFTSPTGQATIFELLFI